jgi:hypothetical protein
MKNDRFLVIVFFLCVFVTSCSMKDIYVAPDNNEPPICPSREFKTMDLDPKGGDYLRFPPKQCSGFLSVEHCRWLGSSDATTHVCTALTEEQKNNFLGQYEYLLK